MAKLSAGLVMYRFEEGRFEVLLVHPGGPFWAKKDAGAWSIPKGEYDATEEALAAAVREFREETGLTAAGPFHELGSVKQAGGKRVTAWAFEGNCDPLTLTSNRMQMEWPPRSGRTVEFAEVDRGAWFTLEEATTRILKGQVPLLQAFSEMVVALSARKGSSSR